MIGRPIPYGNRIALAGNINHVFCNFDVFFQPLGRCEQVFSFTVKMLCRSLAPEKQHNIELCFCMNSSSFLGQFQFDSTQSPVSALPLI